LGNKAKFLTGVLLRVAGFLAAGLLVSMALMSDTGTLAWFSSRAPAGVTATAAAAEDIIAGFYTESGGSESSKNPDTIVVEKAENMDRDLMVYFSLDDVQPIPGLTGCVLHINPMEILGKTQGNQIEYRAPIELKFNWRDLVYLFNNYDDTTTGTLTLRYLNGFIVEEYPITFENGYLWSKAAEQLAGIQGLKSTKLGTNDLETQMKEYITQIITDMSQSVDWEKITSSGRVDMLTADTLEASDDGNIVHEQVYDNSGMNLLMAPATMARARMNGVVNPFERVQFTEEQQSIIDIVAPCLREYIDGLYDFVARLNEKLAEIDQLNLTIDGLNTQIQGLKSTIDEMTQQYADLEQEKVALMQEKLDLEQENADLKDDIRSLKDKIDSLESKNDSLRDKNASLSERVQNLQDENDSLRQEIEDLKHSDSSGGGSKDTSPGGSGDPSDEGEPPSETPPDVEPPDGGSQDEDIEQPAEEPGEEGEPDVEQPDGGSQDEDIEQPAEEPGEEEGPDVESPDGDSGDAEEGESDTDLQEELHQDVLIAP